MSVIRNILLTSRNKLKSHVNIVIRRYSNILTSDLPDVDIPKVSVSDYVLENVSEWPDKVATECAVTGRKYTYYQLERKARNLNRALRKKLKLTRGDVVAILLPNMPEFAIAALGVLKAGLVCTTINPVYTPDEISRQLIDSSAKAILTLNDFWPLANAAANLTKKNLPILTIKTQNGQSTPGGAISFSEFVDEDIDFADLNDVDPNEVCFLPYSSGTTGLPKGVLLTHSNIVANLCQLDDPRIVICKKTSGDVQGVLPAVLPKFHIYGFTVNCAHALRRGNKIVTLPKFSPELYISVLRQHRPDLLFVAPPLAIFLAAHSSVTKEDLASVEVVMSGAAPLGALDEQRLLQKAGKDIHVLQGYGLTETSPLVACTRKEFRGKLDIAGSIGKPAPNTTVKIMSINEASSMPLGTNEVGEIYVKGPQVMKGYHNLPEETNQILNDGWLRTGDIGFYNEHGLLFLTDRLKELIKVKGFQVPPAELEEVLRDFPGVVDAAVIGIPDANYGEVPRAYVVPNAGTDIDVKKLGEYVSSKVAPYKKLRGGIEVVDKIPKNASGKTMRRELKLQYEKENKK